MEGFVCKFPVSLSFCALQSPTNSKKVKFGVGSRAEKVDVFISEA